MLSKIKVGKFKNLTRFYSSHSTTHESHEHEHEEHGEHHDDHGHHHPFVYQHPDNVPVAEEVITPEYILRKYKTVVPKKIPFWLPLFYKGNFEKNRANDFLAHEVEVQKFWKKMRDDKVHTDREFIGEPTVNLPISGKWEKYKIFFGVFFWIIITPIFAYLMFGSKSEFHKKYQLFEFLNHRGHPVTPRPWDSLKKKEDGHWYLKNERVD
jgi:hypothetical protein